MFVVSGNLSASEEPPAGRFPVMLHPRLKDRHQKDGPNVRQISVYSFAAPLKNHQLDD
jgi:hypothetical protein